MTTLLQIQIAIGLILTFYPSSIAFASGDSKDTAGDKEPVSFGGFVQNENGQAVKDATITIRYYARDEKLKRTVEIRRQVKSDSQGYWQYDGLSWETTNFSMSVSHSEYVTVPKWISVAEKTGRIPLNELTSKNHITVLRRGTEVTVDARDLQGRSVTQVSILVLYEMAEAVKLEASAESKFELLVEPEQLRIMILAKSFAPAVKAADCRTGPQKVEFNLEAGKTIRGRVVDYQDNPLSDVMVIAGIWQGISHHYWFDKTDSQGRFMWNEAPAGEVRFDLYSEKTGSELSVMLYPSDGEFVVELHQKLYVAGRVFDADTNEPIPKFSVVPGRATGNDANEVSWFRHETVEFKQGSYRYAFPGSDRYVPVLRIEAGGYLPVVSRPLNYDERYVALNFALKKDQQLTGTVFTPDGEPAAQAQVMVCTGKHWGTITNAKIYYDMIVVQNLVVKTDSQGKFSVPPVPGPFLLAFVNEDGYARISNEQLQDSREITLQKWSRVGGRAYRGGQPVPNAEVFLEYDRPPYSPSNREPYVLFGNSVFTDDEGRFLFDKVADGLARVDYMVRDGVITRRSGRFEVIRVEPGQEYEIEIGGLGRPVIGKVIIEADIQFDASRINAAIHRPSQSTGFQKRQRGESVEECSAAYLKWAESERGLEYRDEIFKQVRNYAVNVTSDGSFRVEDVLPGKYFLHLRAELDDIVVGQNGFEFQVPPIQQGWSEEPLDLGVFKLRLLSPIRVGDAAEFFKLVDPNGREFDLARVRGKAILLFFNNPDYCETINFKKDVQLLHDVFELFNQDERFTMVSISVTSDLEMLKKIDSNVNLKGLKGCLVGRESWIAATRYFGIGTPPTYFTVIGLDGRVLRKSYWCDDNLLSALYKALGI